MIWILIFLLSTLTYKCHGLQSGLIQYLPMVESILSEKHKQELLKNRTGLPNHFDLTNPSTFQQTRVLAEELLSVHPDSRGMHAVHEYVIERQADFAPLYHLAVKVALSRTIMQELQKPIHISILVAMYNENNRMQKSSDHANGEDFINEKARQLQWLTGGTPTSWDLTFIDDGCPDDSGGQARAIIKRDAIPGTRAVYLNDGIVEGLAGVRGLDSTTDSVKGGAIIYGMWDVLQSKMAPVDSLHLIAYTDADLSTDLRMAGLLVDQIINHNKTAAIGSRYIKGSLMHSTDADGMAGPRVQNFVKFRNLLRSMLLYPLENIRDTNCAFKMFTAQNARRIVQDIQEKTFAFDIEILLDLVLHNPDSIGAVPIVWADSLEEATSRDSETHLKGLKGMARIFLNYQTRLSRGNPTEDQQLKELAEYILAMDFEQYQQLCDQMNPQFWHEIAEQYHNRLNVKQLQAFVTK